jgi:DNA (cytosine-5)-methyltransferase 1
MKRELFDSELVSAMPATMAVAGWSGGFEAMRAIELFAGAGGLGIGVSQAGFQPACVVEWDKWCCDTMRFNRERSTGPISHWPEPIHGDVRKVDFRPLAGKAALVSGGPPCQPFSLGGKHRAYDDTRDMWPEAVRAVRETKPEAFLFENVKGLTRASFATYLEYIHLQLTYPDIYQKIDELWLDHLKRLEQHRSADRGNGTHYNVLFRVLNAADYGVPQRRERVVFVGFRNDLGINWNFPDSTHSQDALIWAQVRSEDYWDQWSVRKRDRIIDDRLRARGLKITERPHLQRWQTVRDAIGDLPSPFAHSRSDSGFSDHRLQPGARSYPGHTGSPLDEPAKTLKAGVHGVPGGENMLRMPTGEVRYFSVRESARLQTFPDEYVFHGAWSEVMRQLGNAVPVALAKVIAEDIALHLRAHNDTKGIQSTR